MSVITGSGQCLIWLGWRGDRVPKGFHYMAFELSDECLDPSSNGEIYEQTQDELEANCQEALESIKAINAIAYEVMKNLLIEESILISETLLQNEQGSQIVFQTTIGEVATPTLEVETDVDGEENNAVFGLLLGNTGNPSILNPQKWSGLTDVSECCLIAPGELVKALILIEKFRQAMAIACPEFASAGYAFSDGE